MGFVVLAGAVGGGTIVFGLGLWHFESYLAHVEEVIDAARITPARRS
jgi:hypothetical protein